MVQNDTAIRIFGHFVKFIIHFSFQVLVVKCMSSAYILFRFS
jgi:hypothetical protein